MFVFSDSHDIFPSVEIKGGLCYFLSQEGYSGECEYTLVKNGTPTTIMRNLNDFDVLIREPMLANIVKKVMAQNPRTVSEIISGDTRSGFQPIPKAARKILSTCMMRKAMNIIRGYFILKAPKEK